MKIFCLTIVVATSIAFYGTTFATENNESQKVTHQMLGSFESGKSLAEIRKMLTDLDSDTLLFEVKLNGNNQLVKRVKCFWLWNQKKYLFNDTVKKFYLYFLDDKLYRVEYQYMRQFVDVKTADDDKNPIRQGLVDLRTTIVKLIEEKYGKSELSSFIDYAINEQVSWAIFGNENLVVSVKPVHKELVYGSVDYEFEIVYIDANLLSTVKKEYLEWAADIEAAKQKAIKDNLNKLRKGI